MITVIVGCWNNFHSYIENNLSASEQISLIREIVRKNKDIIFHTASDIIIRELNFMIMLSNRKGDQVNLFEKDEYKNIPPLKKEDIKVFVSNTIGYCETLDLKEANTEETGFSIEFIDEAIKEQNCRILFLIRNVK